MAKDQRLYGKFTLDFPDHEKVVILSDAAFRALVEMTLWSRKLETDGVLARRLALAKWSPEVIAELCSNDDEKPSLTEHPKGWQLHDYAEHQDTKAEIDARRERNRAAGQKGGLAKSKRAASKSLSEPLSEPVAEEEEEEENRTTELTLVEGGTGGGPNLPVAAKAAPAARGTRLPESWMPSKAVIEAMESECPDVDFRTEHRKFVDYWQAKAGKDARKADWNATWRNWIRRAAEQAPSRVPAIAAAVNNHGIGKPTLKAMGWESAGRELLAEMEAGQ